VFARSRKWLVVDEPDRVVVRVRGGRGWIAVLGVAAFCIGLFVALQRALSEGGWAWALVGVALVGILGFSALIATAGEELTATADSLRVKRNALFWEESAAFDVRPDTLTLPPNLLLRLFDAHLAASSGCSVITFGRALEPEDRDWLMERLEKLWQLADDADVDPPRAAR